MKNNLEFTLNNFDKTFHWSRLRSIPLGLCAQPCNT